MPPRHAATGRRKPAGKANRILAQAEPKYVEDTKMTLLLKGTRAGPLSGDALVALHNLQSPHAKMLSRRNPNALPFDDASSLEFLMQKNNCGMFAVASHSKKRPDNLTLGRTFDGQILDMVEFHVEELRTVTQVSAASKRYASKPCLLFVGEPWEADAVFRPLRNLLLDLFRGDDVSAIHLAGIDHVIVCAAIDGKVHLAPHLINLRRSGTRLEAIGPAMVLRVRRHQFPAPDLWALACKQPKQIMPTKVKNVSMNEFGDRIGAVHIQKQDLDSMQLRKRKAFVARREPEADDDDAADSTGKRRRQSGAAANA